MKVRTESAIVVVALLLLGWLALAREAATRTAPPSVASTYDTGPNGYRALYDVLADAGLPVRRFARALALLPADVGTLVIATDSTAAQPDTGERALIERFVRGGGRLVVISSKPRDVIALPSGRLGKGHIIVIAHPEWFANARLREDHHLRIAYRAMAGHGIAAFDEAVYGYDDDRSLWEVLPALDKLALAYLAAIVVLALVGANVPFAPPLPLPADDARNTAAYLDAMAALLRRAHR